MSALSVLYFVLPFPLAFILHDGEEVAVQHRWMKRHGEVLTRRFPKMRSVIENLLGKDNLERFSWRLSAKNLLANL